MNIEEPDEDFAYLSERDWDFEGIPDDEVTCACLWEYARESESFGLASGWYWAEYGRKTPLLTRRMADCQPDPAEEIQAAEIKQRAKARGFDFIEFDIALRDSIYGYTDAYEFLLRYAGPSKRPWTELPEPVKKHFIEKLGRSSIYRPLSPALKAELERLWDSNRGELDHVRSIPAGQRGDQEEMLLYEESSSLVLPSDLAEDASSLTCIALTIDYSRFSDSEICSAFENWVKTNRPAEWKLPRRIFHSSPQRGKKKTEFRTALDRLGLMRLLHWHSPGDLASSLPAAWRRYGYKEAVFRREVKEAVRFFRKLFPFLPADEMPNSAERFGSWSREMDRIAAEVDREFESKEGA